RHDQPRRLVHALGEADRRTRDSRVGRPVLAKTRREPWPVAVVVPRPVQLDEGALAIGVSDDDPVPWLPVGRGRRLQGDLDALGDDFARHRSGEVESPAHRARRREQLIGSEVEHDFSVVHCRAARAARLPFTSRPRRYAVGPQYAPSRMSVDTMPAAVYRGNGLIAVEDWPVPALGPDDVLVEVSHCGICGTDLHLVLEDRGRAGSVFGHEWSGTVIAAGTNAAAHWEAGARVVGNPTPGCGKCRACTSGRPSVCLEREPPDWFSSTGAYCRYLAVPATRLSRIPDSLSTRAAALTEPTAIAVHTVNLSGVTPDDRVLVTGAGPVGLLTIAVMRARGITDITVSEPSDERRARAVAIGAE